MNGYSCSWGSLSLSGKAGVILSKRTRCTVRNPLNTCPQQLNRNRILCDLYLLCPTEACTHLCPLPKTPEHWHQPSFNASISILVPPPSSVWNIISNALLNRCSSCPFLAINSSWQRMKGDFQRKGYLSWNLKEGKSGTCGEVEIQEEDGADERGMESPIWGTGVSAVVRGSQGPAS